ncbi:DUF3027 domain-containing protein [Streptomyces sp. XM4193]|uniref:DUF3027 domain-containing protein n=1 Tax=Streptomyces sp. XM4193 TaxID=2929782 RepID=UPI001FFAFF2B|nr:DUF3027 domain-containing protein [Streptomyces sp. XM4193]MCK1795340.1 DUF3027 domain-containing protein [Streptomyces sp. XM4193]
MRRRTPDRLCAEAVEFAREAAEEAAWPGKPGDHLGLSADGDRVVTHLFECLDAGYRGWRWAVTVARASRAKNVTLDETVLLPGPGAVLAPEWLPWNERLRPGDMGPGDLLPTEPTDLRLESGFTGEDSPPPNSVLAEESWRHAPADGPSAGAERPESTEAPGAEPADGEAGRAGSESTGSGSADDGPRVGAVPRVAEIGYVAQEIGMTRPRVLSRFGLELAAERWEESYGAGTPMAQAAPASCVTCGFCVPLAGSLRQAFGVCANEFAPADGRVVAFDYGCGGHSEAAVMPKPVRPPEPVIDETRVDELSLGEG